MIHRDELIQIGQFNKPHGIRGELSFTFSDDSFDDNECAFLVCELDGIFIPFRIETYRFKSDSTAFVKLKGIDSEKQAKKLSNYPVYFPKQHLKSTSSGDFYSWDYFTGYTLFDQDNHRIGTIAAVDDSTINALFIVDSGSEEILIPASEEIIIQFDEEQKTIVLEIPEGLLDLNA